ncbi:conserved protein of unknown function [Sterolibacterium denitrificans]|uniref:Cytoskeleton protein RodZ-like C-terminal domain-containing protein n=1 Tax=Sterolibacterium denitrificans TaxID=157592 RepID=A0A7Z7MV42_9PROT|nr:helix-turn-helix domain-containing protein [Sterolibacterium denitrificans]SMB25487.1 conserved protein of unknown function [Sterolibacterium denitrificans]
MNDLLDSAEIPAGTDGVDGADAADGFADARLSQPVPLAGTLGQSLSAARQARGLSVADVAQAIKFGARQIEAVERDDFSKLPGATMVRGFIRSYAKLLHIDPVALLALYDKQVPAAIAAIAVLPDAGAPLPQFGGRGNPLFRFWLPASSIVVLLVAIGVYFFWQPLPLSMPSAAVPSEPADATGLPPADGGSASEPVSALPATAEALAAASSSGMPVTLTPSETGAATAIPASPGMVATGATSAVDPEAHRLVFVFDQVSWVEVKDATANVIFAQNNLPGTQQVISGRPPFAVVVGNAPHVRLLYEDRQVDLQPYTKVDVARFNLE